MKQIILFIILIAVIVVLLTSCSKEEIITPKGYEFSAHIEAGILLFEYRSDKFEQWTIWVSPDKGHIGHDTQKFSGKGRGCGAMSTNLYWNPTYVTLEGGEQIKI